MKNENWKMKKKMKNKQWELKIKKKKEKNEKKKKNKWKTKNETGKMINEIFILTSPKIFFLSDHLPCKHIWMNQTYPSAVVYHALRNFYKNLSLLKKIKWIKLMTKPITFDLGLVAIIVFVWSNQKKLGQRQNFGHKKFW